MVTGQTFDQTGIDVQATPAEPLSPDTFDFEAYADYEACWKRPISVTPLSSKMQKMR